MDRSDAGDKRPPARARSQCEALDGQQRELARETAPATIGYLKKRFEDVGFDASAETLMKDWNGGLTRALKGTKAAFTEHWKAAGALDAREFNEAVGRALRNDGEADDPQVARAAKLWRAQVFGPITEAAVKAGLLPDDVEPGDSGLVLLAHVEPKQALCDGARVQGDRRAICRGADGAGARRRA